MIIFALLLFAVQYGATRPDLSQSGLYLVALVFLVIGLLISLVAYLPLRWEEEKD